MLEFKELHIGFKSSKGKKERLLFKTSHQEFKAGDFVALIGPNGSGKTTLFNTILGIQKELGGEILFKGKPLQGLSREEKVGVVSFVPSKFFGVEHLSVYDLIALGRAPYTNILNVLTEEDHAYIRTVISQLSLQELKGKDTLSLSDGERQIAMIGKALAQESKIMILDEPTAFLDYNNRRKILRLLKELAERNNQLIFISSHDLELCFEYCNRIIAIDSKEHTLLEFSAPFDRKEVISKVFDKE